jgi:long-chain acyl-CoA synthetase
MLNIGSYEHSYYDKVIFDKFKLILGGKIRLIMTGAAPISPDVLDLLKSCFGCPIVNVYG